MLGKKRVGKLKRRREKIEARSNGLIQSFEETSNGLVEANEELIEVELELKEVIDNAQNELQSVNHTLERNRRVAEKIRSLIE